MSERDDRDVRDELDAAERLERYLDPLIGGGRPAPEDAADAADADVARLAAELSAATDPLRGEPDAAFLEQLRRRMRQADEGIAAVVTPPPIRHDAGTPAAARSSPRPESTSAGGTRRWRLTRRQVLQAGLGTAAGLAAGVAGASLIRPAGGAGTEAGWDSDGGLVAGEGFWAEVTTTDRVPPGSAIRFETAAFSGFVVNDDGEIRALSSVCPHMGCTLHFRPDWSDLRCPCHGASFDLEGRLANGRRRWRERGEYPGDARAYPVELPPLVRPQIKVEDDRIYVWTAQV